jgi:hypothetical protein
VIKKKLPGPLEVLSSLLCVIHEIFLFEKNVSLLQVQQTIAAKAIIVPVFDKGPLFSAQHNAITLAMHHITRLAFESLPATRTRFFFMFTHKQRFEKAMHICVADAQAR